MKADRTLLQILKAVNYSQTISEVADKLYLSQPYISNLLKKTEVTYQARLITRTKPIKLTAAGQAMINGLQAIISEEDRLVTAIDSLATAERPPLTIAVTDPFMSSQVTRLASVYAEANRRPKLEVRLLADNADPEELRHLDIVIGRKLLESDFMSLDLPVRQLYFFLSSNCLGYQPHQLYQPYSSAIFKSLNQTKYVGLADHSSFQRYVEMSFQKANLSLTTHMLVPTIADALRAVTTTSESTTITTLATAKQVFPKLDFNLIPIPSNFIALDTTINVRRGSNSAVKDLVDYLQGELIAAQKCEPARNS